MSPELLTSAATGTTSCSSVCSVITPKEAVVRYPESDNYSVDLIADGFAILAKAKVKTVEDDMQE